MSHSSAIAKNKTTNVKTCLNVLTWKILCRNEHLKDYEFVSYEKSTNPKSQVEASLNRLNKQRASSNLKKVRPFDTDSKHTIEKSIIEPIINKNKRALLSHKQSIKLTSTKIREQTSMLIKHGYYASSSTAIYDSFQTFDRFNDSSISTDKNSTMTFDSFDSLNDFSFNTTMSFNSIDSYEQHCHTLSSFNQDDDEQTFMCVASYSANLDGDINLRPNDRVKLVYNNNRKANEYLLVRIVSTGDGRYVNAYNRLGYVPKSCLIKI